MTGKTPGRIRYFACITLALLISGLLIISYSPTANPSKLGLNAEVLSDGWTIKNEDGILHEDTNLQSAAIPPADTGDTYILSRILPDKEYINAALRIRCVHSAVKVFLDDEEIYSYGVEAYEKGSILPMCNLYVALPEGYEGRLITISFTAGQIDAFSGFSDILLGTISDLQLFYMNSVTIPFFLGVFLTILAIIYMGMYYYLRHLRSTDMRLPMGAIVSLDLGVFVLAANNIFNLLSSNDLLNTLMEYTSLYLIPTCLTGYLGAISKGYKKTAFLANLMTLINLIILLSTIPLHFLGIRLYTTFAFIVHLLCFLEAFPVMICCLWIIHNSGKLRSHDDPDYRSTIFALSGFAIFTFSAWAEIISYNFLKYFSEAGDSRVNFNIMVFGSFLFVICIFLSYYVYTLYVIQSEDRQKLLRGLAYYDPLTHLSNRAKTQEEILRLGNSRQSYVIISIDMDNLKYVNDTYGHNEGDKLIQYFASMLQSSFRASDLVARIGGDEFLVIMYDDNVDLASSRMRGLQKTLQKNPSVIPGVTCGFSFGICSESEFPGRTAEDVYRLADERMYAMKKRRHIERAKASGENNFFDTPAPQKEGFK
ncbi:sensor domain-containing diguanylate cyclase [Butyrivibrio sp. MC2013]|uniref:sensor domain-containing diguanylate cyclase n=1 Tax=Butyrivibrio sp. MC2013 TaxID=1280686 RepID=UPI00042962BA|nr:GGDEF domain-containing protein [Butyrivibrio sp. MC2013]